MRLPVNRSLPFAASLLLAGCGGGHHPDAAIAPTTAGPGADYPMVIGDPYSVMGTTYRPADVLNYDQVGYASLGSEGGSAISAAHHTLPLPSYVEVTSLDTGRTILVRVERRGPMTGSELVELSPGAAAQLGLAGNRGPVRVRRVNPPEPERALLRSGQRAPERMETPKSLLAVLSRKLDGSGPVTPVPPRAAPVAAPSEAAAKPVETPKTATSPKPARPVRAPRPAPAPKPAPVAVVKPAEPVPAPAPSPAPAAAATPASTGTLVIQAGAFSSKANADAAAAKVGGAVTRSGSLWRVRKGPYGSRAEAEAALAQVRSAGYRDARIQRAD